MKSIKYLGVYIDCHLKWKEHILEVSKKLARGIGILLKLRHFVNLASLVQVYYSIIYSFLTYGIIVWGNTYSSNLQPLIILQKKAIRIITFSDFRAHTSPIFKQLSLLKLCDVVEHQTALFMYQYNKGILPNLFTYFFTPVRSKHQYQTRLACKSTFSLPTTRTNYGINWTNYGINLFIPILNSFPLNIHQLTNAVLIKPLNSNGQVTSLPLQKFKGKRFATVIFDLWTYLTLLYCSPHWLLFFYTIFVLWIKRTFIQSY